MDLQNPQTAHGRERGQVLVIGLFVAIGLVMVALSVANVGMFVAEKIHVQDTVDAAAYSAAVTEARYMNLTAYLNRAMIANYDQMAFNTALWASMTAYDHGLAPLIAIMYLVAGVIQVIPVVGTAAAPVIDNAAYAVDSTVHWFTHVAAQGLGSVFGQNDDDFDQKDFNKVLEIYVTDVLSTYQGLLYVSTQASRYRVIESVAKEMDPEVLTTSVLGLGAEALNEDELKEAVDWIIDEPDKRLSPFDTVNETFNRVLGDQSEGEESEDDDGYKRNPKLSSDEQLVMLGALTEVSLDKFAAGRDRAGTQNQIRGVNFGDLLAPVDQWIEYPLYIKCLWDCWDDWLSFDSCNCAPNVNILLGASIRDREEDCFAQNRSPVIARQRFREVNMFGVDIDLDWLTDVAQTIFNFPTRGGYTSAQHKADIANIDNKLEVPAWDADRIMQCMFAGNCNLNELNMILSDFTLGIVGAICSLPGGGGFIDDHWDGSFDEQVACGTRYYNGQVCLDDMFGYISSVCDAGAYSEGVPKYDLRTDVNLVGWTQYHYDESDAPARPDGTSGGNDHNFYAGPSIAVVGIKPKDKVNNLNGLGIGNDYSISAISRGQVYYLRNPNRPDERPNMMNPHWSARLAPIDSPETPKLLSEGLPYVMSYGAPMKPTH